MLNKIIVVLNYLVWWLEGFEPAKEIDQTCPQQYKIRFYPSGFWSIHLLSDKLDLGVVSYGETRENFVNACVTLSTIIPNKDMLSESMSDEPEKEISKEFKWNESNLALDLLGNPMLSESMLDEIEQEDFWRG